MSKPLGMIAFCVALSCAATFASALGVTGPDEQKVLPLALRGVHFVPNQGQWSDDDVYFGLRSRGLDVAFRASAMTMHTARHIPSKSRNRNDELTPNPDAMLTHGGDSSEDRAAFEHLSLTVSFPGSNNIVPKGAKLQTAGFNYFVAGEGRGVASAVPSFGAVVYQNLYDGVDLHVMGSDKGLLKYEFHVEPGANFGQIRIAYDGIESLCIDASGNLHIQTALGILLDGAPVAWQDVDGGRVCVRARFGLSEARVYRILIEGPVDPASPLVIDPELEWMNYYGGSLDDRGYGIAVDGSGSVFIVGETNSTDFSGRNNSYYGGDLDAYVAKLSAAGELQWMTYLGGSRWDYGRDIALDAAGNALVAGWTRSSDFVMRTNSAYAYEDAFVLKVRPDGTPAWMTYLGGSVTDWGYAVAVDTAGNAFVAGKTDSADFVGRNNSRKGGFDAFAVKVDQDGAVQWMTYLGGPGGDIGNDLATDRADGLLMTGWTGSSVFTGQTNHYPGGSASAFALRVDPLGQVDWMSYLGGTDYDEGLGIDGDADGNVFVTGVTTSVDFNGRNNSHAGGVADAFAVKLASSGAVRWMTYLGGNRYDAGQAIAVAADRSLVVTGETGSTNFPMRSNTLHGLRDAIVVTVSPQGQLQQMMYLGGTHLDQGLDLVLDAGRILIAGDTYSDDFEGRQNSTNHGQYDAFVLSLVTESGPRLEAESSCPAGGPIRVAWTDATPGGQVALLFARNTGSFEIPNGRPCAGTALGLGANQLQIVFQGSAGANGSRTLNSNAGPSACGGYLQLVDLNTCSTSNAVRIE